ncbi:MAG: SDR family oxidoreductase [Thaumarchaeota archaeon]|nr:SDR family oxidoreductase [Nitrososphaerota archaeon]
MQKVALITGCSSGIGKSTALAFAREGIYTFASMRDTSKGNNLAEVAKQKNLPLEIIELDVTKPETIDKSFEKILSEKGKLDILVNNAGFMIMGSFEDIDIDDFDLQWKTDFLGPVIMMKKAIPIMRKQEANENGIRGNIINVSSIAGKIPFAYESAYISSKFALEGLSECVYDEIQDKGIKINIIESGVVKTKFLENTKTVLKENSPYSEIVTQWNIMVKKLFEVTQNSPNDVAQVILQCIKDSSSALRLPVGEDAKLFLEMYTKFAKEPMKFKEWFAGETEKLFKAIE